jgi:phage baseplate assembly protein W
MVHIDYPVDFDPRGGTATTGDDDHIRDMIEQFLFTSPGERVNRPDFGSGVMQLVFAPNSPELAAALQQTVQAGLQRWLGDLIEVRQVVVTSVDAVLRIEVRYVVRRTGQAETATFEQGGAP